MEFWDATSPAVAERFADVLKAVEERHWGLPAVTIDGEPVQTHWFSAWGLIDAVEDWLKARQPSAPGAGH